MVKQRMNDDERRLWVLNDEGLYNWWQSTARSLGVRQFVQKNRRELDEYIHAKLGVSYGQ